jgi:tetratricopeptide (TPR) repeat protein
LLNIGYYLDEKGKHKECIEYYLKAIDLFESINDEQGEAACYNYIGYSFAYINSLEKSVKYYTKAINIYKKVNDSVGIADIYNGFGNIYTIRKITNKQMIFIKKLMTSILH